MCNDALNEIYRSVVLAKLLDASSVWWRFNTICDKQCIEEFVRRRVRLGLYGDSDPTPTQLAENADETLFERSGTTSIMSCSSSFPTTTVFDLDVTTSSCPQKLTNVTL